MGQFRRGQFLFSAGALLKTARTLGFTIPDVYGIGAGGRSNQEQFFDAVLKDLH